MKFCLKENRMTGVRAVDMTEIPNTATARQSTLVLLPLLIVYHYLHHCHYYHHHRCNYVVAVTTVTPRDQGRGRHSVQINRLLQILGGTVYRQDVQQV